MVGRLSLREAVALSVSDFHSADARLVVVRRSVPHLVVLPPACAAALVSWIRQRGPAPGPLFCRLVPAGFVRPAVAVTPEGLRRRLVQRCAAALLPRFDLDLLRLGAALWAAGSDSPSPTPPGAVVDVPPALVPPASPPLSSSSAAAVPSGLPADLAAPACPALAYLATLTSPASRATMASHLRTVAELLFSDPRIGSVPWTAVDYTQLALLRARLTDLYRPATVNVKLQALRGVLKAAWLQGSFPADTYHRLVSVPLVRGTRLPAGRSLASAEINALFESCAGGDLLGARDAAAVALLYGGGLRRNEALCLTTRSLVDRPGPGVTLVGKGSVERFVPLPAGSLAAVAAWTRRLPDREAGVPLLVRLLPSGALPADCAPLSSTGLAAALRARGRAAGIPAFTPHDLRRSYITHLLEADADLGTVRRLAGHRSVGTTDRYDRRADAVLLETVKVLDVPYVADA